MCTPVLHYVTILKAASQSNAHLVRSLCRVDSVRDGPEGIYPAGRAGEPRLCFTLLSDPVRRFYAQYAEMSERAVKYNDLSSPARRCTTCSGPGPPVCNSYTRSHDPSLRQPPSTTNTSLDELSPRRCFDLQPVCGSPTCAGYRPVFVSGAWVRLQVRIPPM